MLQREIGEIAHSQPPFSIQGSRFQISQKPFGKNERSADPQNGTQAQTLP
jgi:hypothetical protein